MFVVHLVQFHTDLENVFGIEKRTDWFDLLIRSKGFLGKPVPNGPKKGGIHQLALI